MNTVNVYMNVNGCLCIMDDHGITHAYRGSEYISCDQKLKALKQAIDKGCGECYDRVVYVYVDHIREKIQRFKIRALVDRYL